VICRSGKFSNGLDYEQSHVILLRLGGCLPCTDTGKDLFQELGC
jgi:hypothetical protein